jgi:CheY-like chemotaxis protein
LLRDQAEAKGLALHVEAEPSLPAALIGDDTRLRQVLINLLSNAVKFTAKGMVWLFVGCEGAQDGVARVRFSVMDTGIGIPINRRHRLFKRFSQVDNSTARQFGGTGLGLAICKSLVEVMGGSIFVESVEGEGTTFSFVLDLPVAEAIPTLQEATEPRLKPASARGAHILLAEDVVMNQELVVALLTKWGHTVEVAPDGAIAVAAVMRTRFDLVLMDVQMPVMDGIEATRRIRTLGGSYATLPIVAMTANVMSRDIAICREAGVDDHIGKPFVPDTLRLLVERLITPRNEATHSPVSGITAVNHAVLDLAVLSDLTELMGPARVSSLLIKMKDHLENNPLWATNLATLRFEAHALISWSGMLGLSELSEACRNLELACEGTGDNRLQLSARLTEAKEAVERAKAGLTHHLASFPDEVAA